MAARRGKSQARRNPSNGIPGWAWLIAGVLLGIVVLLAAPRFLKSDAADDFFRPKPNPDARPAANANAGDDDVIVPESAATADDAKPKETQYDFYTVLPGKEVAMSDAELAASARAEAEHEARIERERQTTVATAPTSTDTTQAATAPKPDTTQAPATTIASTAEARYILQAGAFGASGDAEAVKAKIALLGLSARVESAQINGKTVYRVRMGPYGTASELAEAKQKLGSSGLPAMAIKAK